MLIYNGLVVPAFGSTDSASTEEVFQEEAKALISHQQAANRILGTWSMGSVTLGAIQLFSRNPFVKAFGLQNVFWGGIDGGFSLFGNYQMKKVDWRISSPLLERMKFRRILLINALLDMLYLIIGYVLWRKGTAKWHGHGVGIMVQGGFLFVFDWVNYAFTY